MSRRGFLILAGVACGGAASGMLKRENFPASSTTGSASAAADTSNATLIPMKGQVIRFRSAVYGDLQPFAVCARDLSPDPKPLLVELRPGTLSHLEEAAQKCQKLSETARDAGMSCVVVRPCGRGDGTLYQGYGEADVFEVIDVIKHRIAIDSNRIGVMGVSMGGAATWYNASHYPDFWSGAVPMAACCDFRLWEKPGGPTFPWYDWEEFSWLSRDAAHRPGNL